MRWRQVIVVSLLVPLLGVPLLGAAACGVGGLAVGSGNLRTEDRPVQGFTKVELAGFGTLTVTQSGAESLKVESDDNILPLLTSEVRDATLVLGIKPGISVQPTRVNFTVAVKQLDGMKVGGSGTATLFNIATPSLTVDISGSGEVSSAGRAEAQKIDISGSGAFDGTATTGKAATVNVSGSGSAIVAVSDTLDVELSGSGTVEYIGNPRITEDVSGSGSIRIRG